MAKKDPLVKKSIRNSKIIYKKYYSTYHNNNNNNYNNNKNNNNNNGNNDDFIWLFLSFVVVSILYIDGQIESPISILFLFIFLWSLFTLSTGSLSKRKYFRYIQIFSFLLFIFMFLYDVYTMYSIHGEYLIIYLKKLYLYPTLIIFIRNTYRIGSKLISLLSFENLYVYEVFAFFEKILNTISQDYYTTGFYIGLGATIIIVATVVEKLLIKSSVPRKQQAEIILGASLIGGLVYWKIISVILF